MPPSDTGSAVFRCGASAPLRMDVYSARANGGGAGRTLESVSARPAQTCGGRPVVGVRQPARVRASPFLAGEHPTLADVALYPFATLAGEAGLDLQADAPHVAFWIGQMAALTVVAGSSVNQP